MLLSDLFKKVTLLICEICFPSLIYDFLNTLIVGLRLAVYLENNMNNMGRVTGLCGDFDESSKDPVKHQMDAFDFNMNPTKCTDIYNATDYMICPAVRRFIISPSRIGRPNYHFLGLG